MDIINHIDLINGLNLNPLPLEFSQSMTTTKWLASIEEKINKVIDIRNNIVNDANQYTDEQIAIIKRELDDLKNLLNNGEIIPDGSIGLEKLNSTFMKNIQKYVIETVHNIAKFVWFGIDDNGYFYAIIPETWSDLLFNTDQDGHLILEY